MDDLPSCLTLRTVDSKRDEQHTRNEKTSEEYFAKNSLQVDSISPVALRRQTEKENNSRPEIHVKGTSLIYQNLFQGADDKDEKQHCMHSSQDEQAASSSKDENQADGNAMETEELSLMNTPENVKTLGDRIGQDIDINLLEPQGSLDPSPWSVLQDKSLANYPLSTKSVEFVRDISETLFSTRTNPYTKTRREKPQRIPPLYNARKTVTNKKAKIPSFDSAVTFNTFFNEGQDTELPFDKRKECIQLADHSFIQSEVSGGHACRKHESRDTKDRTIGLRNITCPPTDRYKSKFRVKLLPLDAKSDSLPNLKSKSTSVPSELVITTLMHDATSSENIHLHFPKKEKNKNNLGKESEFINKSRQNRSLSLDSVFSIQSFAAYRAGKSVSGKINVQGFQVLPDTKHTETKKMPKVFKIKQ